MHCPLPEHLERVPAESCSVCVCRRTRALPVFMSLSSYGAACAPLHTANAACGVVSQTEDLSHQPLALRLPLSPFVMFRLLLHVLALTGC